MPSSLWLAVLLLCLIAGPVTAEAPTLSETVLLKAQNEQLIEQVQFYQQQLRRQAIDKEAGCALDWTAQMIACKPSPPSATK